MADPAPTVAPGMVTYAPFDPDGPNVEVTCAAPACPASFRRFANAHEDPATAVARGEGAARAAGWHVPADGPATCPAHAASTPPTLTPGAAHGLTRAQAEEVLAGHDAAVRADERTRLRSLALDLFGHELAPAGRLAWLPWRRRGYARANAVLAAWLGALDAADDRDADRLTAGTRRG